MARQTRRNGLSLGNHLWALMGILLTATLCQPARADDKVLYDFGQADQVAAWGGNADEQTGSRTLSLAAPEITAGDTALKVVFTGRGTEWPGVVTTRTPADWSGYEALKFEVWSINPLTFSVRIDDDKSVDHQSRFGYSVKLEQRKTLVQIPIESIRRTIDPSKIKLVCLYLTKPPAGTTIFIDNIRLGAMEAEQVVYAPFEQRKDAPMTDAVKTPVAWQVKPLEGGPVKLFAIPSIQYGRELAELAQRLDITAGLVTWDRAWDQNTWGMGDHYGQRGHRFDFKDVQSYLSMELAGPSKYDVYVIRTPVGWKWFPKAAREGLLQRVKDGAGLVLVEPYSGDEKFDAGDLWSVSALTHCVSDVMEEPGGHMKTPDGALATGQAWQVAAADHYIVKDLPLDLLPFGAMSHRRYKVAPDAQVLVKSRAGDPIVAVRQFGKGRVVTLAYRAFDMTPFVDQPAGGPPPVSYPYWEVGYALVSRCVLWAAGREAPVTIPAEFVRQAKAEQANPIRVDVPDTVRAGQKIRVQASLAGEESGYKIESVELRDTYGRILERQPLSLDAVEMPSERVSTWAAQVVVHAVDGQGNRLSKAAPVVLQPPTAVWNDYEVIMWPNERLPWQRPLIYEQMRQWGCTATLDPGWENDGLMRERLLNGMRIVPHGVRRSLLQQNPDAFARQKQQYDLTKDKKYLERFVCMSDPAVREREARALQESAARLAKLRPLAYCIGEEDSITSYRAELDLCFAAPTLKKFRAHLVKKYDNDLAALNKRWGTQFASWDQVMPMTSDEAKAHGNFAAWAEHRTFMDDEWADINFFYLDILKRVDNPGVLMGTSGTQVPTPHDGQDWYKLMPAFNWLSSYTYGHQDEMHLNFAKGKPYITAATGYGVSADRARHLLWNRLFHGNAGAIVFWWIAIQNPDLSFCQAGKDLGAVIGELKGGAGRLVFEAERRTDPIAVHYSIPSMQACWITTGETRAYEAAIDAWWLALQELGYQPVFVSSRQIEQGDLAKRGFKALVMPRSIALSQKEKQQIDAFAGSGRLVLGSKTDVGVYDADLATHTAPQAPAAYQAMDPAAQAESLAAALEKAGVPTAVRMVSRDGGALKGVEIVRFQLDDVQMIGILRAPAGTKEVVGPDGVIRFEPDPTAGRAVEPVRLTFAGSGKVYDVRQRRAIETAKADGGNLVVDVDLPAGDATVLAVVPAVPKIGLEVPAKVAQGGDLQLNVQSDADGRRVVRVEVRQPDGSSAAWLTRNLVLKGDDKVAAAVALTDKPGEWSVTATDVITGASARGTFTVTAAPAGTAAAR